MGWEVAAIARSERWRRGAAGPGVPRARAGRPGNGPGLARGADDRPAGSRDLEREQRIAVRHLVEADDERSREGIVRPLPKDPSKRADRERPDSQRRVGEGAIRLDGSLGAPDPSRSDSRTPTGSVVSRRNTNDRTRAEGRSSHCTSSIATTTGRLAPASRRPGRRRVRRRADPARPPVSSTAQERPVERPAERRRKLVEGASVMSASRSPRAAYDIRASDSAARVTRTAGARPRLGNAPQPDRGLADAGAALRTSAPGPDDSARGIRRSRGAPPRDRRSTGSGCSHPDDASALQGPRYRRAPRALVHRVRATTNRP